MLLRDFIDTTFTEECEVGAKILKLHGDKAVTRKFDANDHTFPHTNYRNVTFWVVLEDGSAVGLNEHPTWGSKYVRAGKRAVNTYYEKHGSRPDFTPEETPTEETPTEVNPITKPVPSPEPVKRVKPEGVTRTKLTKKRWPSLDSLRRHIESNAKGGEVVEYFDGLSLLTNAASYYLGPEGALRIEEL